jgi:nitrite reductase/ring-hydroxylating ferredoxin subunit
VAAGGAVYEHTRVTAAHERAGRVEVLTPGGTVRAEHAVIATLMPFVDIGGMFAKARASRAYGLAARVRDPQRAGMYLSTERPTRSTRPWRHGGGMGVIVVGEEHDTGSQVETGEHYTNLETWARGNFDVESVDFTWSAQDYISLDDIPYIGRSPLRRRTWLATGFRKWGLTNASAGALLLTAEICGGRHAWHDLYDPGRLGGSRALGRFVGDGAKVARHFVGGWAGRLAARPLAGLAPGEGGVVRDGNTLCGAYRAPDGTVSKVGLTCTHLGCTVRWNAAETTWDCPCHGSRFAHDGTVLQGPATRDLARRDGSAGAAPPG